MGVDIEDMGVSVMTMHIHIQDRGGGWVLCKPGTPTLKSIIIDIPWSRVSSTKQLK